jgi:hypothetical protein
MAYPISDEAVTAVRGIVARYINQHHGVFTLPELVKAVFFDDAGDYPLELDQLPMRKADHWFVPSCRNSWIK